MVAIDALADRQVGTTSRGRILREARTLFTSQGYAAVSMQDIADAVGINKATLYHHFRDKEDLFVSVMAEEFRRMAAGVEAAIAEGTSLRDQLRRVAAYIFAARHTDFARLSTDLRVHVSERRRAELMERHTPPWAQIGEAVARALHGGEVRDIDPELVGRLFFAMVASQVWWSKFGTGHVEPDERLAATLPDILLDGIGAGQRPPAPADDGLRLDWSSGPDNGA